MQVDPSATEPRPRGGRVRTVLAESAVIAVLGVLLAFTLNALSPRGLSLTRNYFPGAVRLSPTLLSTTNLATAGQATNAPPPSTAALVEARLKAKTLQTVGRERAQELFHDPRYPQNLVVFIDARNDEQYQAGHIPGAYQLDHYRAPDYLPGVIPVCLTAEQIVVYCIGGDCEDSEFAAETLREVGIPNERLAIYVGGFTDWSTNGLPVELGARGSGNLREAAQ